MTNLKIGDVIKYKNCDCKVLFWDGIPAVRYQKKLVKLEPRDDSSTPEPEPKPENDLSTMNYRPRTVYFHHKKINDLVHEFHTELPKIGSSKHKKELQRFVNAIVSEGGSWRLDGDCYIGKCKSTELKLKQTTCAELNVIIPLT